MSDSWDFHGAFATAAGVIPALLLALVLQKEILLVSVRGARDLKRGIEQAPKWMLRTVRFLPPFTGPAILRAMPVLMRPSVLVRLAVLAELIALVGVAVPEGWMQGPGRVASFIALGFVGYAILLLLVQVATGLIEVASATEGQEDPESGDS